LSQVQAEPGDVDSAKRLRAIHDMLWIPEGGGGAWLGGQRVLLFYPANYQALASALMEEAGPLAARRALARMGHAAGINAVALLVNRGDGPTGADGFAKTLSVLNVAGAAQVGQIDVEIDAAAGQFRAQVSWSQSLDVDFYLANSGLSAIPVCQSIIGFLNGLGSALAGVPVAFRELECQACGHEVCRAVGRPVADWGGEGADVERSAGPAGRSAVAVGVAAASAGADADIVGASPGFAATAVDVLFLGETGAGKEVFARALHRLSPRRSGPFVAINCAALPENLIEAELFGVERGAFTGATRSRAGRFERADGGTLFLDELGTLSFASQSKLLRVLQTREIERVGGEKVLSVDVRVVAATNEPLETAVRDGRFREDLYYRLSTFPVRIPPLRERQDDIPLLLSHFIAHFQRLHGRRVSGFTAAALQALMQYPFPGNVRELKQLVERAVILTPDDQPIDLAQLSFRPLAPRAAAPPAIETGNAGADADRARGALQVLLDEGWSLGDVNDALVSLALERSAGNVAKASRQLGLTRAQIDYRLRRRPPGRSTR
jgi:transcriptional regulator with AAA-type ATPase domain